MLWSRTSERRESEPESRPTLNGLAKSYQQVELTSKAQTTRELHEHILRKFIVARWGTRHVDEVKVLELREWFHGLGITLSKATVQKIKAVLSRLYAFGRENQLLPANLAPLKDVKLRGIGKKGRNKKFIIPPEIAWRIVIGLPVMAKGIVMLAAVAALRSSEILGLKWSDLDFGHKMINLNRTWHGDHYGEGKSEASREPVVMGDKLAEVLLAWRRESPYAKDSDWVFPSRKLKGKQPILASQFVKDYLRPRFIQHGLIDAGYRGRAGLHAFRHSLATVLIVEEKEDPKTAQALLRHANSDVTMDVYTHAQEKAQRAAVERFESRMVQ